jgi:hypothetical protein
VPASQLPNLVFDSCVEVALEVNVTDLLTVASALSLASERTAVMRERFLSSLSLAHFVPISGASEFVFSPNEPAGKRAVVSLDSESSLSDRSSSLPPTSAPPPSAAGIITFFLCFFLVFFFSHCFMLFAATWDEASLLTLKELEMFGPVSNFPCFLRISLEESERTNPLLPRVISSQVVSTLPLGGLFLVLRRKIISISFLNFFPPNKSFTVAVKPKLVSVLKLSCLTLPP